jgi:PKD repeat protein
VGTFTGTLYNQVINGRQYFEQTMWSNAAAQTPSGGGSGCAQRLGPTPVFTGAPSSATTTTSPMTLQGGSSYDINSTITNYDWGWGDGSADTTGAATSASHTYSTPGTYPATLTTTDSSGATNATTQTADVVVRDPAHQVKISEFRPQGGGGPFGGFVELYNPTASPVSLTGWKVLDYDQSGIGPSVVATLGAATIAGNGHYLIGFASYPTSGLPNADFSNASAVISYPDALAVVNATGTLQDSVRLNSQPNTFLASGGPVLPIWEGNSLSYFTYQTSTNNFYGGEYGYARYLHTGNGGALGHSGTPQDTNANSTDFALVVPEAQVGSLAAGSWVDGSPEPHNAASQTVIDSSVQVGLLSGTTDSAAPNQEVDAVSASPAAARTMYIRRTLTNQTGGDITRLQFQVSDITTAQKPDVSSQAILRVLSDPNTSLSYNGTTYPLTPMTLDAPANQDADGGGLNSTLTVPSTGTGSISPTTPWHNGTSIDVEFKIGVARGGTFNFYFNTNDDVVYPRGHGSHGPGTPPGRGGNSGSGGHLNGH